MFATTLHHDPLVPMGNKIKVIKAIRGLTGLGLKAAHNIANDLKTGHSQSIVVTSGIKIHEFMTMLNDQNVFESKVKNDEYQSPYIPKLRNLTIQAIKDHDFGNARILLNALDQMVNEVLHQPKG